MKNTICEKLMWRAMTPTIFTFIEQSYPGENIVEIRKKTKQAYREMRERTPDIGSFLKNPLRVSLSGGVVWLSVYEAMSGEMSHESFAEMVKVTMQAPMIKKAFGGKKPFSVEYQKKKAEKDKIANAMSDSEFNWITETIPGNDGNEYTTNYHRCGLCALGRQEHLEDLIPYMCEMDFISVDMMGGVLYRSGTIAAGAEMCDFHIVKKSAT